MGTGTPAYPCQDRVFIGNSVKVWGFMGFIWFNRAKHLCILWGGCIFVYRQQVVG